MNNGWLQELPNPLNKVTWENVALVSPRTAKRLNLNVDRDEREYSGGVRGTAFINTRGTNMSSDLVTLTYEGGKIAKGVPVWIAPGHPDDCVTIFMGYGRTRAGKVATQPDGKPLGYSAFRRSPFDSYGSRHGIDHRNRRAGECRLDADTF